MSLITFLPRWTISTHTPLAGRDSLAEVENSEFVNFYSHAPRGARRQYLAFSFTHKISTHTPLAGRDRIAGILFGWKTDFYSHAPRGARRQSHGHGSGISDFYSHAPRGARRANRKNGLRGNQFLLTRPSRGATSLRGRRSGRRKFLLTRPSRGATLINVLDPAKVKFLLTRPSRGATSNRRQRRRDHLISTHTPLAGRDIRNTISVLPVQHFYSHAPRGARLHLLTCVSICLIFLLTRPSRGATKAVYTVSRVSHISTHTPLAGRDSSWINIRTIH